MACRGRISLGSLHTTENEATALLHGQPGGGVPDAWADVLLSHLAAYDAGAKKSKRSDP